MEKITDGADLIRMVKAEASDVFGVFLRQCKLRLMSEEEKKNKCCYNILTFTTEQQR